MAKILISHVNYPSQFRRLAVSWASQGHEIIFLARQREWHSQFYDSFKLLFYDLSRDSSSTYQHPYLCRFERAIIEGQSVFRKARQLRSSGWIPDIVISHLGFGNGLFLHDCFPLARRIGLVEWFYNSFGSDVDFLPSSKISDDHILNVRTWNAEILLELTTLDTAIVPTQWQKDQFPSIISSQLKVLHEGVDFNHLSSLRCKQPPCLDFLPQNTPGMQVLTYVSRCFEEYRGFPQVMQSIALLQQKYPLLHVVLVGQDGSAYGHPRSDGKLWSDWAKQTLNLDPSRTHWRGSVSESDYHDILSVSDVHYYLTVPFILSWSLLEAMSVGCSLVASSTAPVLEVLEDGHSALLVDFFDISGQVEAISRLLDDKAYAVSLGLEAQRKAQFYSFENSLKSWDDILMPQTRANS